MKKIVALLIVALATVFTLPTVSAQAVPSKDTLIKASLPAVYYYAEDGKRYVFPNQKTYNTWFSDFSNVVTVTDEFLASVTIGGNVTYRPGTKMIKITTDPKVYHVSGGSVLRWVKTEALAVELYGPNWNTLIEDVPDAFFTNYTVGTEVDKAGDLDLSNEVNNFTTINSDKGIAQSDNPLYSNTTKNIKEIVMAVEEIKESTYVWAMKALNKDPYLHRGFGLESVVNGFVGAWYDDRNGQNEIMYQRIDPVGDIVNSVVRVSSNISDSTNGKALYNGNIYVLWEDSSPLKRSLELNKFSLLGNSVRDALYTSTTFATSKNPDFAWNSVKNEFGITWWDTRNGEGGVLGNLFFGRLTIGGLKIGDTVKVTGASDTEFSPQVLATGVDYMLFWQDPETKDLKVARVDHLGVLQEINIVGSATEDVEFNVAWNGENAAVLWLDSGTLYYTKLDSNARKVGQNVALVKAGAGASDIEWGGNAYAVAYEKAFDIYYFEIDAMGTKLNKEVNITNSSNTSLSPVLKKSATEFAVGWVEKTEQYGKYDELMVAIRK